MKASEIDKFVKMLFKETFILNKERFIRVDEFWERCEKIQIIAIEDRKEVLEWLQERYGVSKAVDKSKVPHLLGITVMVSRESLCIERHAAVKNGRFIFTTAHAAAPADEAFLGAMQNWVDRNSAEMVILPANAHVKALEGQPCVYANPILDRYDSLATKYTVNSNLVAMDVRLLPQQREPLTGLLEWGQGKHSVIVAAPRQRLKTMATGHTSLPRAVMSTGACTKPDYHPNRIGELAKRDHVIGALVVEADGDLFHARHVQAYADGSFIDVALADYNTKGALRYYPDGTVEPVCPEAMVLGDIHGDLVDPVALLACEQIALITRPKILIVHEIFDGETVNPHHKGRTIVSGKKRHFCLADELDATKAVLDGIIVIAGKIGAEVMIVESNHDIFLERHLNSMDWKDDNINVVECAALFARQVAHGDALKNRLDPNGRCRWISTREDVRVGGFQVSNHGHIGVRGARGSLRQLSQYVKHVTGHAHEPEILQGSIQVACLCQLKQDYNIGLGTWMHSVALLFPEQHFLHINILNGAWTNADLAYGLAELREKARNRVLSREKSKKPVFSKEEKVAPKGESGLPIRVTRDQNDRVSYKELRSVVEKSGVPFRSVLESLVRMGAEIGWVHNHCRALKGVKVDIRRS